MDENFDASQGLPMDSLGISSDAGGESAVSTAPAVAAPAAAPAPAAQANPWDTPPKAWESAMHQHYGTLPPEVRQYIHQREKQALDGLMKYKTASDKYEGHFKPYMQHLQAAGVQPEQLVADFVNVHAIMSLGTPEQKQQMWAQLSRSYGMDQANAAAPAGNGAPDLQASIREALSPITQKISAWEQQQAQAAQAEANKAIDAFLDNKDNEFATQLLPDMAELIRKGSAGSLAEAYELAALRHPEIRAKYLQKQLGAGGTQQVKTTQSTVSPLPSSSGQAAPKAPTSLEAAMRLEADKLFKT